MNPDWEDNFFWFIIPFLGLFTIGLVPVSIHYFPTAEGENHF
jgi:hypothetical protein